MESRESKKRRIHTRRLHKKKSGDIEGEISRFFLGQILPMNFQRTRGTKPTDLDGVLITDHSPQVSSLTTGECLCRNFFSIKE